MQREGWFRKPMLGAILATFGAVSIAQAQAADPVAPQVTAADDADARIAPPSSAGFDLASLQESGGLTADDAAQRAVETGPTITRAEASVALAEAGADQAFSAVLPQVSLSARYTRLSRVQQGSLGQSLTPEQEAAARNLIAGVTDPAAQQIFNANLDAQIATGSFTFPQVLDNYVLSASVSYPLSDLFFQILPGYAAANHAAEAARYQVEVERRNIAMRAREAFYAYARARGAAVVAASAVAQVEAHRAQVDALVQAGAAAPVDRMRVDAQLAAARVAVAQTQGGVDIAAFAIRALLHLPEDQPIALGEDLVVVPTELAGTRAQLLARARENRAELKALRALREARDEQVDAAVGAMLPSLIVSAAADYANPNQRVFPQTEQFRGTWSVSAILSWSPNVLFSGGAQTSSARAQVAQVDADLASLEDALRVEVGQAHTQYETARQALEAASVGIQAAEESYRVRLEQLRAGTAVTSDLIDTETELTQARLQLLNAAIDTRIARARVLRATGE